MRILRIIHSAHPRSGGPINGILNLDPLLSDYGIETKVLSLDSERDAFWSSFPGDGIGVGPGRGFYGFTLRLDHWLERYLDDFDLVIIHGLWQYHGVTASRWCLRKNIPYAVYSHGMLDPWFRRRYPLKHFKKMAYWFLAERQVLRDAKAVCFTTDQERILARESFPLYNVREVVVPYGTIPINNDFPRAFGDKPYLLYLGRIHEKKGLDLLLNAYRKWSPISKPRLCIAGEDKGNYANRLRANSSPGVEWLGAVKGDMKWSALAHADALVLPSHQENFGMVVAESLSVGTPVLTTYAVNTSSDLDTDRVGLVEDDSVDGILKLLERWNDLSGEEIELMRRRAIDTYNKRYNLRNGAKRLSVLFQGWVSVDKKGVEGNGRRSF